MTFRLEFGSCCMRPYLSLFPQSLFFFSWKQSNYIYQPPSPLIFLLSLSFSHSSFMLCSLTSFFPLTLTRLFVGWRGLPLARLGLHFLDQLAPPLIFPIDIVTITQLPSHPVLTYRCHLYAPWGYPCFFFIACYL